MIGIAAENSKSMVSVLFDDWQDCWCRDMELVLYNKCCCFCHHSKKAGRQTVLHMGLISYSFVEFSSRIWTTTTSTLAAHSTYKTFENNLCQGCKFNPFFSGLWFLQALLVMPASVSQRGCNGERKMRTRL
ncbi:hypothetical protein CY35_07G042400 [Sphagnum magellanicum]|jgi:hypothetical protein|uniref:Uncharacterized protein n=1 Tax=Sphagnum magellanicum TaxID=128215 RepID=A0ACB8HKG9_9BRYO|nr:hypothetical protein CY35_07G042400 [Sphagnum magellanicum]